MRPSGSPSALPTPPGPVDRAARLAAYALLTASCIAVYARIRFHFFFEDDWMFLSQARDDTLDDLHRSTFWFFQPVSFRLYWVLLSRAFGPNPAAFDAAQMVLLWLNGIALIEVTRCFTGRTWPGLAIVALTFASPSAEVVTYWNSCCAYLLSSLFLLLGLLLLGRSLRDDTRPAGGKLLLAGSIGCYWLSWLSRNSSILFPLAFLTLAVPGRGWTRGRRAASAFLVAVAFSVAWLSLVEGAGANKARADLTTQAYAPPALLRALDALTAGPEPMIDRVLYGHLAPRVFAHAGARAAARALLALGVVAALVRARRDPAPHASAALVCYGLAAVDLAVLMPVFSLAPSGSRVVYQANLTFWLATVIGTCHLVADLRRAARIAAHPWIAELAGVAVGGLGLALWATSVRDPYESEKRAWHCTWRQLQWLVVHDATEPIVVDRAQAEGRPTFHSMVHLFWTPWAAQLGTIDAPEPSPHDVFRVRSRGDVFHVGPLGIASDGGPLACPIPPPAIHVAP